LLKFLKQGSGKLCGLRTRRSCTGDPAKQRAGNEGFFSDAGSCHQFEVLKWLYDVIKK